MKPQLTLQFFRTPFLVLLTALSIGVFLGYSYTVSSAILVVISSISLFLVVLTHLFFKSTNGLFILAIFLVFVLIGFFSMQQSRGEWEANSFEDLHQQEGEIIVKLQEIGNQEKEWVKVIANLQQFQSVLDTVPLNESIVLFIKKSRTDLKVNDLIVCNSIASKIKNAHNPGEFDAENYWNKKGVQFIAFLDSSDYFFQKKGQQFIVSSLLEKGRLYFKSALEKNLKGKDLAIALALVLGDKSLIDSEITASFTNTGAMHVLAVSGLHIGIIMQLLMVVFGFFPRFISKQRAIIIVVVLMWAYSFITGLSPSVLRAVFMFSVLVLAQLMGKNYSSLNTLFFTGFVLIFLQPFTLFDIGFQLSFLAMLGIFLVYKPIEALIYTNNKILLKIWQGTAIGFAAQLFTTPLSLYYFHQFPNYFILSNIGLMATSGLILGMGIFLFLVFPFKFIAKITGIVLGFILFVSLWFIEWVEHLPGAVAYGFSISFLEVFLAFMLVLFLFFLAKNRFHFLIGFGVSLLFFSVLAYRRYGFLKQEECIIFNARSLIVTLRKKDHYYCFYKCKPDEFEKKVKYVVENYRKQLPAPIDYFSIQDSNWKLSSPDFNFGLKEQKNYSKEITLNKKKITVVFSHQFVLEKRGEYIAMPWIKTSGMYSLNNGAYKFIIE
jgi:competence protein ComEC